jgi:hypothetical protein
VNSALKFWTNVGTPTKIVLSGQMLALMYAIHKKGHITSVVTGLTIIGTVLAEWQAQKAYTDKLAAANVTEISNFSQLGRLKGI